MEYTIKSDKLTVCISDLGAELQSILKNDTQYLWQGSESTWKNKATNIFPFVGKMEDGKYMYKDKIYEMGSHGLARHTTFLVDEKTENKISFKMSSNDEMLKNYPFYFDYYLIYEIINDTINITSKVINKGNEPMYFGLGGHPGFNVPLTEGLNFEDYYLQFDDLKKVKNIKITSKGLISYKEDYNLKEDKILNLKHSLFDEDALIFENMSKGVMLKTDKDDKAIYLKYDNMNYLGIWHTPKTDAPFVCIEPWTSLAGKDGQIEDIEKCEHLIRLDGHKDYTNKWQITIY